MRTFGIPVIVRLAAVRWPLTLGKRTTVFDMRGTQKKDESQGDRDIDWQPDAGPPFNRYDDIGIEISDDNQTLITEDWGRSLTRQKRRHVGQIEKYQKAPRRAKPAGSTECVPVLNLTVVWNNWYGYTQIQILYIHWRIVLMFSPPEKRLPLYFRHFQIIVCNNYNVWNRTFKTCMYTSRSTE